MPRLALVAGALGALGSLGPLVLLAGCGSPGAKHCALAAPALPDWRVRTDGQKFRDSLGRVVLLRGVDAGGRSKFAPYVPFDFPSGGFDGALAAYLDRAASWGVNVFRLPFTWAAVEPAQGVDDAQFLAHYDAIVDGAWARGIRVVIDFHQDVYAENFCGDGFPAWTIPDPKPAPHHDCPNWGSEYAGDPAVQAAFDHFWSASSTVRPAYNALWDRLSARYRDKPGVIGFELINEPNNGTAALHDWEMNTLTPFYSAMGNQLRAGAPKTLLFFDAPGVEAAISSTNIGLPDGGGWVFAPHYYQPTAVLLGGDGDPDQVAAGIAGWANYGKTWNIPVFIGEFGAAHDSADTATFLNAHWDAFDSMNLSGTEWEYSQAAEGWNSENFGMVAADGTEYPIVDAIARPYARALSGDGAQASYDGGSKTWSLAFTADGGVSEIALPSRTFAKGADVQLSSGCIDDTHAGVLLVQASAPVTLKIKPR
ncbi:MAG TPA: cellulase family glycosylhydrolase [Polyangia bacterium]|nr:cellulase family glycosylhydrolase [Polyangia bacterium]